MTDLSPLIFQLWGLEANAIRKGVKPEDAPGLVPCCWSWTEKYGWRWIVPVTVGNELEEAIRTTMNHDDIDAAMNRVKELVRWDKRRDDPEPKKYNEVDYEHILVNGKAWPDTDNADWIAAAEQVVRGWEE